MWCDASEEYFDLWDLSAETFPVQSCFIIGWMLYESLEFQISSDVVKISQKNFL